MSKKVPLYLCDKKRDCNGPCYRECRLTHDINHTVRDVEGNPIIITYTYFEDPGDTWSAFLKGVTE